MQLLSRSSTRPTTARAPLTPAALLASALLALGLAPAAGQDPYKDVKSKDVVERLAAVDALGVESGDKALKALVSALKDKDLEVVERAAGALANHRDFKAVAPLVDAAIDGPVRRIRIAAAHSLTKVDPTKAVEDLDKLAAGRHALRACEALAILAPVADQGIADRGVEKALKSVKEPAERRAAARAFTTLDEVKRELWFEKLIGDADPSVQVAALEAVEARPEPLYMRYVMGLLQRKDLSDVVERRAIRALRAMAQAAPPGEDGGGRGGGDGGGGGRGGLRDRGPMGITAVLRLMTEGEPVLVARGMRLAGSLGNAEGEGAQRLKRLASTLLAQGIKHSDASVRAAAYHAGGALGEKEIVDAAVDGFTADPSARVRTIALRVAVEARTASDEKVLAGLKRLLESDDDPIVREEAAVALAVPGLEGAREALSSALADREWSVAAVAAVSLGKLRDPEAVGSLAALYGHDEWKRRGAAVVGLTHVLDGAAVPAVIAALEDPEPAVARTAHLYLRRLGRSELPAEPAPWTEWWAANGEKVRFGDPEEEKRRREKYGYAKTDKELFDTIFQELDVVVLDSRGDHIQELLKTLSIKHRMTAAARHAKDALHPGAVYVSNCTGEVEPADIDRLQWFVRTGGYLFGSCWSLSQTIEKVYPGVVAKYETSGEVLDTVIAEPVDAASPYLEGVFDNGVQPIYHLEGAHLIRVLDPERAEVLIDSPDCASRWGEGNLAVWFKAGHGLILDSVNHFDLQGLEVVQGLKKPEERQAYAVDHLGYNYEELRVTEDEKWWGNNLKASEHVFDLSAFRFLTNFVRRKRLNEDS